MTREDHITQARRYIRAARRYFDMASDGYYGQDQIDAIRDEAQCNRAWARDHLAEAHAHQRRAAA
jgi:hypothetical protein